jgi:hypothetical protein
LSLRLVPLASLAAAFALAGCMSAFGGDELARAPAWFKERQKELAGQDYPDLASVPGAAKAVEDAPRWAQVERELKAEAAAIAASPRSAPAPAADTEVETFEKDAREAIGATRPTETARPQ